MLTTNAPAVHGSRISAPFFCVLSFATAATSTAPTAAHAEAVAGASMAPIVVTAARAAQPQTDALPFTTVISADDIRASQAVDLPSLLRREAGIQFTQNGGYGQAGGLFVRGAETRQTLIMVDGIPLTKQDATGTVSIEHLMLDQVDHVEIVRGNVSSIYGSSAIGGVIQIFTRRSDGNRHVTAEAESGSRGTARLAAGISGSSIETDPSNTRNLNSGANALRYALNASNFRTSGFSALNPAQLPNANPDRDGYRNTSVSGSLTRGFGQGNEAGANFTATRGRFDFDSSFGTAADVQSGRTDVGTASVFLKNRFSDRWSSRFSYSESRDRNANHYDTALGISDDHFESRTRIFQWTNQIALAPAWSGTVGYERQWQRLSADDGFGTVFNVNRNADSLYAGIQGKLEQHQLQFNLRHDAIDRVDPATTGYLGYGYVLSPQWKALASVSTGFAAPPLGYLYSPGFGNPNLKPERSHSAELGLQYADQGALVRAALFDTHTREQLEFDVVGNTFGNVSRARNRGLDLSASATVAATVLRASVTLQDPRNENTDERLRRRAKTLASLAAHRSFGAWQLGSDLGFTGSRPDLAAMLPAYALVNLNARYQLARTVEVYGRVENLFDRDFQTASGYNQPPRGVFVGVRWQQ